MARNTLMIGIGGLSVALLVAAAIGTYRLFSYLAALLILATVASASIERADRELDPAPYTGLLGWLAATFLVGLTGIWLLWDPNVTEYSYVLGLPLSTFVYFLFIWLLPILGAVYYSMIFERIGGEAIVDDIIQRARDAQEREELPLAPQQVERTTKTEATDD